MEAVVILSSTVTQVKHHLTFVTFLAPALIGDFVEFVPDKKEEELGLINAKRGYATICYYFSVGKMCLLTHF